MLLALSVSINFVMISSRTLCGQPQPCRLEGSSPAVAADEFAAEPVVSNVSMRHAHKKSVLTLQQSLAASTPRTQAIMAPAVEADVQQTTKQVNQRSLKL